ncbi:MAG: tetratricopeptide repeat protein [Pseudanabaena sp.]
MKKFLLLITIIGSCVFCNSAIAAPSTTEAIKTKSTNTTTKTTKGKYDVWMRIGYKAYDKKDYNTALINFKRALKLRPKDVYATKAIQNMERRLAGK